MRYAITSHCNITSLTIFQTCNLYRMRYAIRSPASISLFQICAWILTVYFSLCTSSKIIKFLRKMRHFSAFGKLVCFSPWCNPPELIRCSATLVSLELANDPVSTHLHISSRNVNVPTYKSKFFFDIQNFTFSNIYDFWFFEKYFKGKCK